MRILLAIMVLGLPLAAQDRNAAAQPTTKLNPAQIREPAVPAASVRIVMPNGTVVYAQLDMAGFVIDTTTTPPTLRLKATAAPPAQALEVTQVYRSADGTFALPEGRVVFVNKNGLAMLPGTDYSITGRVLRMVDPCCEADEIVTITVQR